MITIHKKKKELTDMTIRELFTYVHELQEENARLEESFQRATGAVAADALPTFAEMRKISEMCKNGKCDNCPYLNKNIKRCRFVHGADYWDFGGADDDDS